MLIQLIAAKYRAPSNGAKASREIMIGLGFLFISLCLFHFQHGLVDAPAHMYVFCVYWNEY